MTNSPNTTNPSPAEEHELRQAAKLLAEAIVESIEAGDQVPAHGSDICEAASEILLGGSPTLKQPSDDDAIHGNAEQKESPAEAECEPSQRPSCEALDNGSCSVPAHAPAPILVPPAMRVFSL